MTKMYFRVAFFDTRLSNMSSDNFTNEDEALEYAESICRKYSRYRSVNFEVIKYYEWLNE